MLLRIEIYFFYIVLIWIFWYFIGIYFYKISFIFYNKLALISLIILLLLLLFNLIFFTIDNLEQLETIYFFNNLFFYNISIAYIQICMLIILIAYLSIFFFFFKYYMYSIFEYIFFILCSFLGLQIMIICNNLFLLWVFLEVVNLCLYCLLGLNKTSNFSIEAAFKYFIQSAYITLTGFFALSILYLSLGTLNLNELILLLNSNNSFLIYMSSIFLILNLFFKLGLFPLHSWLADIYQASPIITILFIATVPKITYIIIFFKFLVTFNFIIIWISLLISFCTIIYGSFITLYQINIKRLLGYGSMVHLGLIIYIMSIYTIDSISAAFFYMFAYIILIYFILCFFLYLFESENLQDIFFIENLSQLNVILNKNKILSFMCIFILFSFAGLPIFIGFFAKWSIFFNLILTYKYIEVCIFLFLSLISTIYYIRLLRFMYFFEIKIHTIILFFNLENIKQYRFFLFFFLILFFINIFIIFYYSSIYVLIWKYIYIYFK